MTQQASEILITPDQIDSLKDIINDAPHGCKIKLCGGLFKIKDTIFLKQGTLLTSESGKFCVSDNQK